MEQKKILSGILSAAVVLCSASCGAAKITREKEAVDFKEYFAHYDEMMGNDMLSTGYTSYDVREMERQIDGFWDYYERYEKAQQDLDQTIEEWDADFIGEGTYIAGSDIPAGKYVFCNPDGDNNDDKNAVSTSNKKDTSYADIFKSPHFSVITLQKDDVLKVKGSPKLAPWTSFRSFPYPRMAAIMAAIMKWAELFQRECTWYCQWIPKRERFPAAETPRRQAAHI